MNVFNTIELKHLNMVMYTYVKNPGGRSNSRKVMDKFKGRKERENKSKQE